MRKFLRAAAVAALLSLALLADLVGPAMAQLFPPAPTVAAPYAVATPKTIRVTAAQTVTASSAYSSGNVVGGKITFANAVRVAAQGGIVQSAVLRDKAGQNVSYDLFLFDADPSATTVTDKAAVALNTADLGKGVGVVQFSGVALGAASTMGISTASGQGLAFKLGSGSSLYAILVTRGTPTYASTSDVSVDLIILPD